MNVIYSKMSQMQKARRKNTSNRSLSHFMKYALYLLPVMWLIAIAASLVEAYFYPGVILKHTSIDPVFIYLVFGITGLFWQFGSKWGNNKFLNLFQKINFFTTCILEIIYISINLVEKFKYRNFVFSNFHIQPAQLSTVLGLAIYTGIITTISSKNIFLANLDNLKKLFKTKFAIMAFLLWIIFQNFIEDGMVAAQNLPFMIKNPEASYDQKMEEKLGKQFYDYALFVKKNTPENAKILLPPFPAYPWPQTGNRPYMTYFLYPRTLLNGEEYSAKYDLEKEGIDYVLLAWGETEATSGNYTHGWPKFDVSAEKIVYMVNDKDTKEKIGNYIYKDVKNEELWGVIKVKK